MAKNTNLSDMQIDFIIDFRRRMALEGIDAVNTRAEKEVKALPPEEVEASDAQRALKAIQMARQKLINYKLDGSSYASLLLNLKEAEEYGYSSMDEDLAEAREWLHGERDNEIPLPGLE